MALLLYSLNIQMLYGNSSRLKVYSALIHTSVTSVRIIVLLQSELNGLGQLESVCALRVPRGLILLQQGCGGVLPS